MSTLKKLLNAKDQIALILIALYFCLCYFTVSQFDIYSVTPSVEKTSPPAIKTSENMPPDNEEEFSALITDTRTLKEYRGVIGIFDCFGCLLGSFDIDVSLLPYADRKSLDEGIVFANENEMRDFLASLDS